VRSSSFWLDPNHTQHAFAAVGARSDGSYEGSDPHGVRYRYWLVVLLAVTAASCGGPDIVQVYLECPSPDKSLVAVLWAEAGGGAAGWRQELISIHPSNVPIERTPDRGSGEEAPVLAVNSAEAYELKWEANDRLLVTVEYSDRVVVHSMRHTQTILGRRVRVTYQEREGEEHPFAPPKTRCGSGPLRIENPVPRKLK
jgi:hypothetical protein